jgi:hypothetical protein
LVTIVALVLKELVRQDQPFRTLAALIAAASPAAKVANAMATLWRDIVIAGAAEASLEKSSPSMFCIGTIERRSWDRWRQYRTSSCKIVQWRATADEDGHYCFAVTL